MVKNKRKKPTNPVNARSRLSLTVISIGATASLFLFTPVKESLFDLFTSTQPVKALSPLASQTVNIAGQIEQEHSSKVDRLTKENRGLRKENTGYRNREDQLKKELGAAWQISFMIVWKELRSNNFIFTSENDPVDGHLDSKSIINMSIERLLTAVRFDTRGIDVFTESIRTTVREFQAQAGISIDGIIGAETWETIIDKLERETGYSLSQYRLNKKG